MAETTTSPKRKGTTEEPQETAAKRKPAIAVGDSVEYKPGKVIALVTGVNRKDKELYLDSPVCSWVPMSDCKA